MHLKKFLATIMIFSTSCLFSAEGGDHNVGIRACGDVFHISQPLPTFDRSWNHVGMDYIKKTKNDRCLVRVPSGVDRVVEIIVSSTTKRSTPITPKSKIGIMEFGRIFSLYEDWKKEYSSEQWESFYADESMLSKDWKVRLSSYMERIGEHIVHSSKKVCGGDQCMIVDRFYIKSRPEYEMYNQDFMKQNKGLKNSW